MSFAWSVSGLLLAAAACGGGGPPTYAGDVAAILHESCAPCHRPGASAPFSLLTYDDAYRKRRQIARVTGRRLMPPWLPTHGDFIDDRRLDDEQIATIARWVDDGALRGDAGAEPAPPVFATGWQLREPDIIAVAPAALTVPADGPDRFRNLVIPVDTDRVRFVQAVEILPGNPAVHHAILQVDATRESRRLDALDPEPGFPGMAMGISRPPDGHFLGWTPGKRPHLNAAGMAWRLWPGNDLVLQLHLTPTGKPETVRPQIGLYFTDAPTEVQPYALVLYSEDIDIPAGESDYVVRDQLTLPVPATLHAVYPHAHYLCRKMRGTATLPDGTEQTLFAIDRWDFDWQDDYRYREPIELPAGTRLAIEYHYDNSAKNPANPHSPPRAVKYGLESTDEMGTATLTLVVEDGKQRLQLQAAYARRSVEKKSWDPEIWLNLAIVLRDLRELEAATQALGAALQLRADHAGAHRELGICALLSGRTEDAEQSLAEAIRLDPNESIARMHLGEIYARSGRTPAAIDQFRRAVQVHGNHAVLRNNLATALFVEGQLDEAAVQFRRALTLDEEYFNARFNLGRVLAAQGRAKEARVELQRAAALRPGDPNVRDALDGLSR